MSFDLVTQLPPAPDLHDMPGLRPYQREMVADLTQAYIQEESLKSQLIVSATGTGKTVMMAAIARTFVHSGQKVLLLAHTEELLAQARDKFQKIAGVHTGLEKAEFRANFSDKVVVASVQTMRGWDRIRAFPSDHFGAVMVDEAHRTMAKSYLTVLNYFDQSRVVGVTATADRGDKKLLGEFYERLVVPEYNMKAGIDDGWLVRVEVQPLSVQIDLNGIGKKRNTDGDSDLDMKEVSHRIVPYLKDIAADVFKFAGNRRILGFTPSVEVARMMVDKAKEAGFKTVDWVAGEDTQRSAKIAKYKRGEIQVLWNAMLLTEGFDQDDIDALVILRPTEVRALYTQMVGRGTRPLSSIVGQLNGAANAEERRAIIAGSAKPHVLVLDPLWLHEKHDLAAPACLVSPNIDEQKLMKGRQGDLLSIAGEASRDLLDSLRKKILENANRRVARIDPFTFGVVLGHEELANYHPQTLWDARDPTAEQLQALVNNGVEAEMVRWRGQAQKILGVIEERQDRGLCSIRLMNWLKRHNIDATTMTHEEATRRQRTLFKTKFR